MRIVASVAAGLLLATPAQAQKVFAIGIAFTSCATWLAADEDNSTLVESWIDGFWSGLNANNPKNRAVGASTDPKGIYGEIRLRCRQRPSETLYMATSGVYLALEAANR